MAADGAVSSTVKEHKEAEKTQYQGWEAAGN